MGTEYDDTEFVDREFQAAQRRALTGGASTGSLSNLAQPPSREELDTRVTEAQQKLAELKRQQEELERERSALEEARRRLTEFQTGRTEIQQHLTRGIGILEEAEFIARRDAEQMTKTLEGLREALTKVGGIQEQSWTRDTYPAELTRALTTIENARMEWNSARLKWPRLSTPAGDDSGAAGVTGDRGWRGLKDLGWLELCKVGLALSWPLAAVALAALVLFLILLLRG
jgi:uncharacterized protein YPO0396